MTTRFYPAYTALLTILLFCIGCENNGARTLIEIEKKQNQPFNLASSKKNPDNITANTHTSQTNHLSNNKDEKYGWIDKPNLIPSSNKQSTKEKVENTKNIKNSIPTSMKIIYRIESDLDLDGDKDFILVTKPKEQDIRNFYINIALYRQRNSNFYLWHENSDIFKDNPNGCMLDGLEKISASSGQIKINYSSCYDRKFANRTLVFSYDSDNDDFLLTKNTIAFTSPDTQSETIHCKHNVAYFSSYDDRCQWW